MKDTERQHKKNKQIIKHLIYSSKLFHVVQYKLIKNGLSKVTVTSQKHVKLDTYINMELEN